MRYRFKQDDDGHWYLVPEEWDKEFDILLEASSWQPFCDRFDEYRIGSGVESYTFTDPRDE